jgi:hypothetical protein
VQFDLNLRSQYLPLEALPAMFKLVAYLYPVDSLSPVWKHRFIDTVLDNLTFPESNGVEDFKEGALTLNGVQEAVNSLPLFATSMDFTADYQTTTTELVWLKVSLKLESDSTIVAFSKVLMPTANGTTRVHLGFRPEMALKAFPVTYRVVAHIFPYSASKPTWKSRIASDVIKGITFDNLEGQNGDDLVADVASTVGNVSCNAHRFCTSVEYCHSGGWCASCDECLPDASISGGCPTKCESLMSSDSIYTLGIVTQSVVAAEGGIQLHLTVNYDVPLTAPLQLKVTFTREQDGTVMAFGAQLLSEQAGELSMVLDVYEEHLPLSPESTYSVLTYVFIAGSPAPNYSFRLADDRVNGIEFDVPF